MSKPEVIHKQLSGYSYPIPIILLHGAWHGAWCFEILASFLVQMRFQCRMISFRDHETNRKNKKARIWPKLEDYLEDVERAVAHIDPIFPPIIIGHSMGGLIAQMYAQKYTVSALVLLSSIPSSGSFASILKFAIKHPLITLKFFCTRSLYPAIKSWKLVKELLFSSSMSDEMVKKWQEKLQNESFWAYLQALIPRSFSSDEMCKPTPVLVLHAENDQLVSFEQSRKTAQSYGADLEILPGMAHCDMLAVSKNAERTTKAIAQWLKRQNVILPPS